MYIDSPNFPRRKVFNAHSNQRYQPNKRWDQGIHGSDRDRLAQHVANTLKQHEKDSQILQKFRKQAANYKKQYMAQKYPALQAINYNKQKTPNFLNHIIVPRQSKRKPQQYTKGMNQFTINNYQKKLEPKLEALNQISPTKPYQQFQTINKFKQPVQNQKPYEKIIIKEVPIQSGFDMNLRMDYERIIQKKNRQIQIKDQKLRKKKIYIQKLQRKIMKFQKEQQLQKMVKEQDELKSIKNMLSDLKDQVLQNGASFKKSLLQRANQRRNFSQLQLSKKFDYDFINPQTNASQQLLVTQSKMIEVQKNPSIVYSPVSQKKKSSFQHIKEKEDLQKNLSQMKMYNHRLDRLSLLNNQ